MSRPGSATAATAAIAALVFALALTTPAHAADAPPYDGFQVFLDDEAHVAMAAGDFARAREILERLLAADPDDGNALRELGRVAQAQGDFKTAVRALGRADELHGHGADPELHYLRGEALFALGRKAEADRELDQVLHELGPTPTDPQARIWLARIAARRGDLERAEALYRGLLPADVHSAGYAEIFLYIVEAHIQDGDWAGAERLLRTFLDHQPGHVRGRELLAWVLEGRGKAAGEVALRTELRAEREGDASRIADQGRALERSDDYPRALATYREARAMGSPDVGLDIERMELRLAPELAAAASYATDPTGTIRGAAVAGTIRFTRRNRFVLVGGHEVIGDDPQVPGEVDATAVDAVGAWAMLGGGLGASLALGTTVYHRTGRGTDVGGAWALRTPAGKHFELQAAGELHMPWRDAALTLRDGGIVDGIGVALYATPFGPRLILGISGRLRRLGLGAVGDLPATDHALQTFGSAGVDYVLSSSPRRILRGEVLDEGMLWPVSFGQAVVASYRHYELASDDPFGMRLALVDRSAVDEVSMLVRRVFDARGIVGGELRGGVGYDQAREVRLWRAGGSLTLAATATTRLSVLYDITNERGAGITGRRHAGGVSLHVDL